MLGAFVDLILERGYAAVTVDDVARLANVGRSTLYSHFGGLEGLLNQSLLFPSTQLADLVDQPVTAEALTGLLAHFKTQRRRNRVFFVPPIRGRWARVLANLIEPRLAARAAAERRPAQALPWSLVSMQVAETQIALVANWLEARSATPVDLVATALIATTKATIESLAWPVQPLRLSPSPAPHTSRLPSG